MVLREEGVADLDHFGVTVVSIKIEQSLLHPRTTIELQSMKAVLLVRAHVESIFPAVTTGVSNVSENLQRLFTESAAFDCDIPSVLCDAALSPC